MTNFTINPNELESVWLSASYEATRYYLNGVCFEVYNDNAVALIATDGHRMSSINGRQDEQPQESFILANDDIKKILSMVKLEYKSVPKSQRNLVFISIEKTGVDITISCTMKDSGGIAYKTCGSFTTKEVGGQFPDWRRILPSYDDASGSNILSFNTAYMADFGRVAKIFGARMESVVIDIIDKNSPIKITLPGICNSFLGVLMPIRC